MPDLSTLLDPFKMGEDLPAQLEMVRRLAPLHCVACDGYHLDWAERRAKTDRETEMFYNPEFMSGILAAIGRLHGAGHRFLKFFIAGSADTKLLAACAYAVHVQKYLPPDAADFHIMDACETPLQLSHAYADRFGLRLTTTKGVIPGDIPKLSANLLVVSGFMRFIPDALKAPTLARLHSLLTEGGAMAFTQSIRTKDDRAPSRYECGNPAELRKLIEQAAFVIEREATTAISLARGSEDRRQRVRYSVLATSGLT